MTPKDTLAKEIHAMSPHERKALRAIRYKVASDGMEAVKVRPREVVPSLSKESAKQFRSQILTQRGGRAEKAGLRTAEKAEKKSAAKVNGRMAKLQKALQEAAGMPAETTVQAVAKVAKKRALEAEIAILEKEGSDLSADFTPGNSVPFKSGLFKSVIAPGLTLRGRIDALRIVEGADGGEGEMHIIEHKARQGGLFGAPREYERIQCLGYIHLVRDRNQRERGQSMPVRCILVETFEGDTSRREVLEDADLWGGQVVDVVGRRAGELRALVRGDPSASDVLSWLEGL